MTLKDALLILFAGAVLIGAPIAMIWSMVVHFRTKPSDRRGGAALGAALQELDRLVARPSVEHTVEAERRIVKLEEDQGGQ